ncbi:condensation domain-containing protein [Polynucleobacter necessarius]|uniref:condensation domain-containing protein n=1 Tax=Polynucleobacter necessarius TaxID=576610 RepID=UPI000E092100|nr:condensation domain-containing protein [Polynucleobacter necessarius]
MSMESSRLSYLVGASSLDVYPLTGAQNNVWYHQQLDLESSVYHIGSAITFSGHLEIQHLEAAWKKVIAHVDTLRSSIILQDGTPFQKIHAEELQ